MQPSLESRPTTSVLYRDDTSDDGQQTDRDTTNKKITNKKSPVVIRTDQGCFQTI